MQTLDLVLRVATCALAFAAAAAVLLRPGRRDANGLVAFTLAGLGMFMVASAPGAHTSLGPAAFVANAWCLATPVAVWMVARVLFGDGESPPYAHVAGGVVLVAVSFAADYGRHQLGFLAANPELARDLLHAGRGIAIALLAAACVQALLHWRADLVEPRRRMRAAFVCVVGGVFVASAGSEFVFAGRGAPPALLAWGHGALLVLSFVLLQLVARGVLEDLIPLAPQARAAPAPLRVVRNNSAEAALGARVIEAMGVQRLWRRERLGIAELAHIVGTQEYLLRRAINRHLGYRNFNDFLHDWRLSDAAARLADPREAHLPVLTLALDSGYGSIGPFNRAFKARFGLTPTEYRAQNRPAMLADSETGAKSG